MKKGLAAVIVITLVMLLVAAGTTLLYLWVLSKFPDLTGLKIAVVLLGAFTVVMSLAVFRQRYKEIKKGEEDDLGQY